MTAPAPARGTGHSDHLEFIRRAGRTTRKAIADHTGLSRSVVAQAVAELIAQGLVVERRLVDDAVGTLRGLDDLDDRSARTDRTDRTARTARTARITRRGRPSSMLELAHQPGVIIACDIGHRHLTVAVCDLQSRVLAETRTVFAVDEGAAATFRAVHGLVTEQLRRAGATPGDVKAFGVSFPFPVVRSTGAIRAPDALPGWQQATADQARPPGVTGPLVHDNDANFGAWGEHIHGSAPARDNLLYVKLSDGIGAGLIVNGMLLSGSRGTGGEMGHIQVEPGGALCRCGRRGCLETVVAASLPDHHRAGLRVGRAVAQLCTFIDAEVVVLGGQLGASGGPLVDGVREAFAELLPDTAAAPGTEVTVRVAALGARAELVGIIDRTLTAAWASGSVGACDAAGDRMRGEPGGTGTGTGTGTAARAQSHARAQSPARDIHSSYRRTNSPVLLEVPLSDERFVMKE